MKLAAFRVRALDRELDFILQEADARCSIAFALRLDEMRERLSPLLEALGKSQARILRRFCDKDERENPKLDDKQALRFSTAQQQESMDDAMSDLNRGELEIPDLGQIRKADLIANGLAAGGTRITNLRPILDMSYDEPSAPPQNDRTVYLSPPRGVPHA